MKTYNSNVYIHFVPDKTLYVGKTSTELDERWRNGEGYRKQKEFYSKIQEFGWDKIEHVVFKSGLTKDEAATIERDLTVFLSKYEEVTGWRVLNVQNRSKKYERTYSEELDLLDDLLNVKNRSEKYERTDLLDENEDIIKENVILKEYIRKLEKQIDEMPYNEAKFKELKGKYEMLQVDHQNLEYVVKMLRSETQLQQNIYTK